MGRFSFLVCLLLTGLVSGSSSSKMSLTCDDALDYGFTKHLGDARWRVPIALQGVFALAALVALVFFPDTPRWYYARGR